MGLTDQDIVSQTSVSINVVWQRSSCKRSDVRALMFNTAQLCQVIMLRWEVLVGGSVWWSHPRTHA